jgi:hypothetical protein
MNDEFIIHGMFKADALVPHPMTTRKSTLALLFSPALIPALILGLASPASAQRTRSGEQDAAMQATREGAVRPLRQIESQIVPRMRDRGANYIGAEFDGGSHRYRLKFMRESSVIWVDVDGKSGTIIAQAGN